MAMDLGKARVLVTGGSGFLGAQVVDELRARGAQYIAVPRSRDVDLTDQRATRQLFERERPDLVLHLAAKVGGIGANQKLPGTFFRDNMAMGLNVLEEARRAASAKLVVAGTICAYPKFAPVPFREDDLWNGYPEETNAPYGLAKKMMLVQSQSYREQYGFNSIFLLPANLYGPGDNFDLESSHVIPALIRKCVEARDAGQPFVEAWGTGNASREFLYVEDCAEGLLRAAALYNESEPVNIGTGREIKISELLQLIARLARFEGEIRWQSDKPDGQPRRRLEVSRALEKFGFKARTTLEEGLRKTIEWYESRRLQATDRGVGESDHVASSAP